ncbi:MAG: SDR family oxidoreductase [Chloroflexota bacterium]
MAQGPFDLSGRVALVTGASQGIGLGIALALARAGADVVLTARRPEPLAAAATQVEALGVRALAVEADVLDPASVERMVAQVLAHFGRVDILVNNVGGSQGPTFQRGALLELSGADVTGAFDHNVRSVFEVSRAVAPHMRAGGRGVILNIGSTGARDVRKPVAPYAIYDAAKAAVISLSRSMAFEWGPQIRVNTLVPGATLTDRLRARGPEALEAYAKTLVLERFATPEDIGAAAVYLASDAAGSVTAATIDINGGE